jgi:hypothetical protein
MRKLREMLKKLEKEGYETVTIQQVLIWMHNIQSDARVKRLKLND